MKTFAIILLTTVMCSNMFGQTMKWIPSNATNGACPVVVDQPENVMCYTLEYTPEISGVLTSYTTGFYATCTSKGVSVISNESCSMNSHVRIADACTDAGKTLFTSSGSGGSIEANSIEAKKPVILHQVCFLIPPGESVVVTEEENIDLITSIDVTNGSHDVEYPAFEMSSIEGKTVVPVDKEFHVSLSPNPARQFVNVEVRNAPVEAVITILDTHGKVVTLEKAAVGSFLQRLNTEHLSAGLYTLTVAAGDHYYAEKFVVIR